VLNLAIGWNSGRLGLQLCRSAAPGQMAVNNNSRQTADLQENASCWRSKKTSLTSLTSGGRGSVSFKVRETMAAAPHGR